MTKLLKIIRQSIGALLEWMLICIILLAFFIRSSSFQTYLAEKATTYLSKELNAEIKIDEVSIIFLDEVALEGVLFKDQQGNNLIKAKTIYLGVNNLDLSNLNFGLENVNIEDAHIHLIRDKKGTFNYDFIKEYFASEKKRKKRNVILTSETVTIKNTRFQFDDNRKERRKTGVDYFHIDASQINLELNNFKMDDMVFNGELIALNCNEKSGFQLDNLRSKVTVSEEGIFLSNLNIKAPGSDIYSEKLFMKTKEYSDIKSFVDNVQFEGRIDSSVVSLKEAAYFAYILEGMTDTVELSTSISKFTKNLRLSNFDLKIKDKSRIKGTINIPDYRNVSASFIHEKLDYVYVDINELKSIKMPNASNMSYISIDPQISRLGYFEAKDIRLDGFSSQFVIASEIIKTRLGDIRMDNGVMFTENKTNNSYIFERSGASEYDVKIENFNLGKLIGSKDIGTIDGIFFLSGQAFSSSNVAFRSIEGHVNHFEYLDYPYQNISIVEGELIDKRFEGKIDVHDDNLDLVYSGSIDFKNELHLLFSVDVQEAQLAKLNISKNDIVMSTQLNINLKGKNPNDFKGTLHVQDLLLYNDKRTAEVPSLNLDITRTNNNDAFVLNSDIISGKLTGKLNLLTFTDHLARTGRQIAPGLFRTYNFKENIEPDNNNFQVDIELGETKDLLAIFYDGLTIANGTSIKGEYKGSVNDLGFSIQSDGVTFSDMDFTGIDVVCAAELGKIYTRIESDKFVFKDSIEFRQVELKTDGTDNMVHSKLTWDPNEPTFSTINWTTEFFDLNHYQFIVSPSTFSLDSFKWQIAQRSEINVKSDTVQVNNFKLSRGDQFIHLNGTISQDDSQKLNFDIQQLKLDELSTLLVDLPMDGTLNAQGSISNPFYNFQYFGNAQIDQFFLKNYTVGDVALRSEWNPSSRSIDLNGNLLFKKRETFDFEGRYFPLRKKDNLDFNLLFNYTDIQFTNAFLDPDVLSEIKGLLLGTLQVKGSIESPELEGKVKLVAASARLALTGAYYGIEGDIEVDKDGFYINSIPIYDEDGNAGSVVGSVYHSNFKDFNFDVLVDLEDDAVNRDPFNPWKVLPLERFLVLNSNYKEGDIYYGKGYATGTVNLFGYTDNIDVTVNLKTEKGTKVNIPMFGTSEIDDENNFIIFIDKDTTTVYEEPKIDFTGVDLDLNFKITPDAEVKLIFNENIGDIITARGKGDMNIQLDNLGDVRMKGVYTVTDGVYDFAMGIIKQKFFIEPGGSISWSGDPYDALLDLSTYYKVNANIATVTGESLTSGTTHQDVLCYLNLSESLSKPTINFDIQAPRAGEGEKAIINRIKSDPDELSRQFFSLLLWKSFQPLSGQTGQFGNTALDLAENQINALLSKFSDEYKLNVDMNTDQLSGDNSYEFGISKGFLDDRLILSGSFGVENQNTSETTQSNLIGDVNLEYLLNKTGTFRINIFNESNDRSVIQTAKQGSFTQGIGIYYKEDFNSVKDFKLIQYFLDIFRKKENKRYPIKRKKRQVPVPKTTQ